MNLVAACGDFVVSVAFQMLPACFLVAVNSTMLFLFLPVISIAATSEHPLSARFYGCGLLSDPQVLSFVPHVCSEF